MHCPYCHGPLREESFSCSGCGLTLEKATDFFGEPPALKRGVHDPEGVLTAADVRLLGGGIAAFERRCPGTGFTAAFMALPENTPAGAYAWWLFNQCNPAGETQEGPENCHLFLLVDTVGKGAWMTLGYGLEPFIGERHLRQFLEGARPHFSRGEYAAGAALVIREAGRMIQEMAAALPRIFGLPREATESRSVGVR